MNGLEEEFRLEAIAELHAVSAGPFVPFVIERLSETGARTEAVLHVDLRGVPGWEDGRRHMRLLWDDARAWALPPGVPDSTVTERAALGVACAVIWHFAGLRLSAVSLRGDRFDYWVQREDSRLGLEVSGTLTNRVIFSFHRFVEDQ